VFWLVFLIYISSFFFANVKLGINNIVYFCALDDAIFLTNNRLMSNIRAKKREDLNTSPENRSILFKVSASVFAGLLCFLLSKFHVSFHGPELAIDIPWTLIFPLVISLAYGVRYALVTGLFGGAAYPFYLWPANGWGNVFSLFFILVLFLLVGIYADYRRKESRKFSLLYLKILFTAFYALFLFICVVFVYNYFLSMNPAFWYPQSTNSFSTFVLSQFYIKDIINFSLLVVFSDALINIIPIRRFLGLPVEAWMRNNTMVLFISFLVPIFIWALIYFVGNLVLSQSFNQDTGFITLSFFILFWSGGLLGRVMIRYQKVSLKSKDALLKERDKVAESELKFRALFDNAPDMYLAVSPDDLKILVCNDAFLYKTGFKRDEVLGANLSEYYCETDANGTIEKQRAFLLDSSGLKGKEFLIKKKDGSTLQVELNVNSVANRSDDMAYFMLSWRDISERKEAEKNLKQSEENFRLLVRNTFDGILISDSSGRYLYANKKAAEISGYSRDELVRLSTRELTPTRLHDEVEKRIQSQFDQGVGLNNFEATLLQKSGNEILIEIVSSITTWKGAPAQIISFRDITERKKAEQELLLAKQKAVESDRLKSAFLANMSHEIRTPMNGILGFTSLLNEPGLTGEQQQTYIDIITKSGARMLATVNDIIEISKIETGQINVILKEVDLNERIENLILFFNPEAKSKGLELIYEKSGSIPVVFIDENKLNSIVTNLIKNALKFTNKGWVRVACEKTKETVEISVTDTGIGIPDDRQRAIFNRFEQADIEDVNAFEGSGLGLAITKSYVEMMKGKISLQSVFGKGSTFTVSFPADIVVTQENEEPVQTVVQNKGTSNAKLNILISEDDENSYLHLSILLKQHANKIIRKQNGAEAVEFCKNNPNIDLILMDIKMPVMDGYQATKEIRKFNKDVIIVAQTAYALEGDRSKSLNAGCNDYITKPIKTEVLNEILHNFFQLN